jgi:hypothetical protein
LGFGCAADEQEGSHDRKRAQHRISCASTSSMMSCTQEYAAVGA